MKTIVSADPVVKAMMGKQKSANKTYRLSRYVLKTDIPGGQLLYHSLTCELLSVDYGELTEPKIVSRLIECWFMVAEDFDEFNYVKRIRNMRQLVYKAEIPKLMASSVKRYWILTTTDCNAKCFYCHEKGIPLMVMTEQTAADVVNYIIQNSPEKDIFLNWYGGEPLFNKKVIDIITSGLLSKSFSFSSSMISNGLLFNDDIIKTAASLWNLKQVQITLDGLEETYNRVKGFNSFGNASPFKTVINNIALLLENKIRVQIRLNIDTYNKEELFILADHLISLYGKNSGFSIYSAPLFEECLGTTRHRTDSERNEVYEAHYSLREKLYNDGVLLKTTLPGAVQSVARCIAVSSARVIFPDGQLAFCHDYAKGVLSGDIYGNEPGIEERMAYTKCIDIKPECFECRRFPQCVRLEKCFNNKCNQSEIKDWELTTMHEMLWMYQSSI